MALTYLLDTDVISETAKPKPSERVLAFVATCDEICLSAVTIYELSRGALNRANAGSFSTRGSQSFLPEARGRYHSIDRPLSPRRISKQRHAGRADPFTA